MPFLEIHGARVRYRETGTGRPGTPVVLLHGAGASSAVWLPLAHRLGRARRAIALDLPGHGRSTGAVTTLAAMRDELGEVAGTQKLGRAVLVGHSLGGLVALEAALAWPDRVAALALVATAARIPVDRSTLEAIERGWPRWPERFAEVAFSPETPAEVRRRGAGLTCLASQEQTLADYRALAASDLSGRLGTLRCPALVISGEHDLLTPARAGAELARALGGELLVLPRCGHMPMFEQPDALAVALGKLVAGVP